MVQSSCYNQLTFIVTVRICLEIQLQSAIVVVTIGYPKCTTFVWVSSLTVISVFFSFWRYQFILQFILNSWYIRHSTWINLRKIKCMFKYEIATKTMQSTVSFDTMLDNAVTPTWIRKKTNVVFWAEQSEHIFLLFIYFIIWMMFGILTEFQM